jgi:hypothetical protein
MSGLAMAFISLLTYIAAPPALVLESTTNKIAVYCQQITILGLISSFHHYFHLNVSPLYVSLSQLAFLPCKCSLSEVSDSPLHKNIAEIVVKYNKNIRCVE